MAPVVHQKNTEEEADFLLRFTLTPRVFHHLPQEHAYNNCAGTLRVMKAVHRIRQELNFKNQHLARKQEVSLSLRTDAVAEKNPLPNPSSSHTTPIS